MGATIGDVGLPCPSEALVISHVFFMNTSQQKLLQQKIQSLPLSPELLKIFGFENMEILQDVLDIEIYNWSDRFPGFTQHHRQDFITWLEENDLTEFLKED